MQQYSTTQTALRSSAKPRRNLSPKQIALLPLTPLFQACKAKGLPVTEDNRLNRLRAVNLYLHEGELPFNWLVNSFKELLSDTAAILVVADAVEHGGLRW